MMDEQIIFEINEALNALETIMLNMESKLVQQADVTEPVHLLLRKAHSMKSALQVAGRTRCSELIHELETLFSGIRDARIGLSELHIDAGLDAIDCIRQNLNCEAEDEVCTQKVLNNLVDSSAIEAPLQTDVSQPGPFDFNIDELSSIVLARKKGQRLYVVEKLVTGDLSKKLYDNLPVREDMESAGALIAVRPGFEALNQDHSEEAHLIRLVGATELSTEELELIIFDTFHFIEFPKGTTDMPLSPIEGSHKMSVLPPERITISLTGNGACRVLVVDDDSVCQLLLQQILKEYGICDVASDGVEAVAAVEESIRTNAPYDLICMDIMMPNMSGHQALAKIRRIEDEEGMTGHSKIVMITALGDYTNLNWAFRNRCDSYIVKPIKITQVRRQLSRLGFVSRYTGSPHNPQTSETETAK